MDSASFEGQKGSQVPGEHGDAAGEVHHVMVGTDELRYSLTKEDLEVALGNVRGRWLDCYFDHEEGCPREDVYEMAIDDAKDEVREVLKAYLVSTSEIQK